jgi:hypothetical protein
MFRLCISDKRDADIQQQAQYQATPPQAGATPAAGGQTPAGGSAMPQQGTEAYQQFAAYWAQYGYNVEDQQCEYMSHF